jgi:Mannosyltransferase (PIG-V)
VTGRRRLRDGLRPCLAVFVAARLALSLWSVIALELVDPLEPVDVPGRRAPEATDGWAAAIDATERQDAVWYLRLADRGWSTGDASAAFFPLYPLTVRLVTLLLPGDDLLAALLVSNLAFLGALLVLFALTAEAHGDRIARRAIVVATAFPTAVFFLAPYSESLFLFVSLLAFREARRDRWWLVALVGGGAALTRGVGLLLVPALAVDALRRGDGPVGGGGALPRPAELAGRMAGVLAIVLAPLLWLTWWGFEHGRWLAPVEAQRNWSREVRFPLATLWDAVSTAWRFQSYWLLDLAIVGLAIAGLLLALPALRGSEALYGGLSLLLPLLYPFPDRPLLSMPRFAVVVFPALWGLAGVGLGRRIPFPALVAVLAAGWALCVLLFVNWLHLF